MKNPYKRKKQPETVRLEILRSAVELSARYGIASVTLQATADMAGVTKGGLLHHFPSKEALIAGVYDDMIKRLDEEIDSYISQDPVSSGIFTRAYVRSVFSESGVKESKYWSALLVSTLADPVLSKRWSKWLESRLERHKRTDGGMDYEIVRLAADGAWFNMIFNKAASSAERRRCCAKLLSMTLE